MDPARWHPCSVLQRVREWITAKRWRRRIAWVLLSFVVLFVVPAIVGAVAVARGVTGEGGASQIHGLAWTNVRDSSGVPVSSYLLATDQGSVLEPLTTIICVLLNLEFIGYLTIQTTAIWLIGEVYELRWLDWAAKATQGGLEDLASVLGHPIVMTAAATVGAFCVAWFIARGFQAKAARQVAVMLAVAVLGPVLLADPLAPVYGPMMQGRDVGVSVAAGLSGDSAPNPLGVMADLQAGMADLLRLQVQIHNFGHSVDRNESCRMVWSSAVLAGDADAVKEGMRTCGDSAAFASAQNPTMGQVGTGLLLLFFAVGQLLFAGYTSYNVLRAGLDGLFYVAKAIVGVTVGGYIYGAPQTGLIKDGLGFLTAILKVASVLIFSALYLRIQTNMARNAEGQVIAVLFMATLIQFVAIVQMWRLREGLNRGADWFSDRFASAIQGGGAVAGSGGGRALGMGPESAAIPGLGFLAALTALNTLNASPALGWLWAGTPNPLNPLSRKKKTIDTINAQRFPWQLQEAKMQHLSRMGAIEEARERAANDGGFDTALGVASAYERLLDLEVSNELRIGMLEVSGATRAAARAARIAASVESRSNKRNMMGYDPVQRAIASALAIDGHAEYADPTALAARAVVSARFAEASSRVSDPAKVNEAQAAYFLANPDRKRKDWEKLNDETRWEIGRRAAQAHSLAAYNYYLEPSDINLRMLQQTTNRLSTLDHLDIGTEGKDPWDE
ncbi:hypothetical protein GCM10023319_73330 [Nocardia iowensis]